MIKYLLAVSLLLQFACTSNSNTESTALPSVQEQLASCTQNLSNEQITDNVRYVEDYNQSLHELIACGNMTFQLIDVIQKTISSLISGTAAGLPSGLVFNEGTYQVTPPGYSEPVMSIVFKAKVDSSLGKAGELIVHQLNDVSNYLTNPSSTEPSLERTEIELSFEGLGPLVELLGFGTSPTSPIILDESYILKPSKLTSKFSELLEAELLVSVRDSQNETSTINYDVKTPASAILAIFEGDTEMAYEVLEANGARSDLNQTMTNNNFDLTFLNGSQGAMNGQVDFSVSGGVFDYAATLTYEQSMFGSPSYRCAED